MSIKTKTIIGNNMADVKKQIKQFMATTAEKGVIKSIEPFYDEGNHMGVAIRYEEEETE